MTDHPITPPRGLMQQWREQAPGYHNSNAGREERLMERAGQWCADQELEACCRELEYNFMPDSGSLRAARRPKPPSLKEQGLQALEALQQRTTDPNIVEPLRLAVEALPDD
jgi:hypothetical protein